MNITIRKATPEDASSCLQYMNELLQEENLCLPTTSEEFHYTLEQEESVIKKYNASENSIFLVAVDNNRVIGILTSEGGRYKANKHVTTLGMSIHKDYRNSGIGHKLLSFAIDWARQTNIIKRIELFVYERNISAIHLYKKLDFKKEGKRINAFFHNGRFENDYIMGLSL